MKPKKAQTLILDSWFLTFAVLSDAEAGQLIKAIGAHVMNRPYNLPDHLQMAANEMFASIDDAKQAYNNKCEQLRANASKSKANVNQMQANAKQLQGKDKDIDKDKDKDKDNIQKENIKEKVKAFKPPTLEEVKQYCEARNNKVDAEAFIDFYTSKNWFIGSRKMANWQAAVRTWEKRETLNPPKAARKTKTGGDAGIIYKPEIKPVGAISKSGPDIFDLFDE